VVFFEPWSNAYIFNRHKIKPDDKPTANNSWSFISKSKLPKYNEPYLSLGFTSAIINSEE
jgi:hypothetical protein